MLDENTLAKQKEANRLRQKKHYELNREKINEKRRMIYKEQVAKSFEEANKELDKPVIVEKPVFTFGDKKIVDLSKGRKLSYNDVVNNLDKLELKPGTLSKYKQDIKRLVELSGCDNIILCFKRYQNLIDDIKKSKKQNGEPYSNNTLKGIYQMILFIIDRFNLNIKKQPYLREYEIAKLKSVEDNNEKANTNPIMKFSTYLNKVKDAFGEKSKMYVLAKLYDELTLRDDYQLVIVNKISETKDDTKNYIVMYPSKPLKIIINSYKTQEQYGVIKENLSKGLNKLVRDYVRENSLKRGDYLFGKDKLSSFITANNKRIGLSGGVSEYRHMKISEELEKVPSLDTRKDLSERMRHSPLTQLKYVRKVFKE